MSCLLGGEQGAGYLVHPWDTECQKTNSGAKTRLRLRTRSEKARITFFSITQDGNHGRMGWLLVCCCAVRAPSSYTSLVMYRHILVCVTNGVYSISGVREGHSS
jgi:hypothetical protein